MTDRGRWDEIYALPFDSTGFYNVYGIAVYNGRPVVCFAGYEDSTGITVHKDKICVIGQSASTDILEYDEEQDLWHPIDSVIGTPDTPYGYLTYKNVPSNRFSLASDGKHLFVAGSLPWPFVYMGDYGEPYGNEEKGWRAIHGNFCPRCMWRTRRLF